MSLSGTQEGGALMMIDATNYSEQNTPATTLVPSTGGQRQVTQQALNAGPRLLGVRPRDHAVSAVGRHQPRAGVVPPV